MDTHPTSTNHHPHDRLHDIESAQLALGGIGRSTVFELIRTGALGSVKIGRRRLVPQSQIDSFIARQLQASDRSDK